MKKGNDMHIELKQETETERADREDFARAMDVARLQGRLEAFAMAMTECSKTTRHEDGSMGGRDCREIHTAIDILHLDTLRQMKTANYGNEALNIDTLNVVRAAITKATGENT